MGFIEIGGINDVSEPQLRPEAAYDLVIVESKLKEKEEDGTTKYTIFCVLGFDDDADSKFAPVFVNLSLPNSNDDAKVKQFKSLQVKRFCALFDLSSDGGVNLEEWPGSRATCAVNQKEYPPDSGTMNHNLVIPPMKGEAAR